MKKQNIRKIILEELLERVNQEKTQVNEGIFIAGALGIAGAGALVTALDAFSDSPRFDKVGQTLSSNPKNNFFGLYGKAIDKIEGPLIISDSEANKLAKQLADATINFTGILPGGLGGAASTLGFGLGTDEDALPKIIKAAKSKVNLAKVGLAFGQSYNQNFMDVFKDELSGSDQNKFIIDPIMQLPFIQILDESEVVDLSEKEFMEEIKLAKEDEDADPSGRPDLGLVLTAPFIPKIIKVMNSYNEIFKLEGYTPCVGEKWTSSVQKCWELFFPHAIVNCDAWGPEYDMGDFPNGSKTVWTEVSGLMSDSFPRYTNNPKGCLAFCLDAYYCDIRFGRDPAGAMFGDSESDGGGKDKDKEKPPQAALAPGGKVLNNYAGISIELGLTGKDFKDAGFTHIGSEDPDFVLKSNLMSMQSLNSDRYGFPGNTLNFDLVVNNKGSKVTDVTRLKLDGSMRGFKPKRREMKSDILSWAQQLSFPSEGAYEEGSDSFDAGRKDKKVVRVTVTIPAGRY